MKKNNDLPQEVRKRIKSLVDYVLALNVGTGLTHNRLSGAIYNELLQESNKGLTEDEKINLAVNLTTPEQLPALLKRENQRIEWRRQQHQAQVRGIVRNCIPAETQNREQVIEGTLAMLKKFPTVDSITGIMTLVRKRVENGHKDVEDDRLHYLR